jgi:hypothetical protein
VHCRPIKSTLLRFVTTCTLLGVVGLACLSVFEPWLKWSHSELPAATFGTEIQPTTLVNLLPFGVAGNRDVDAAPKWEGVRARATGWTARVLVTLVCITNISILIGMRQKAIAALASLPLLFTWLCIGVYRISLEGVFLTEANGPAIIGLDVIGPACLALALLLEAIMVAPLAKERVVQFRVARHLR